jgi:EAL domain-containing protein (putative c-di-GMP-specific phosphodiesterase class I)
VIQTIRVIIADDDELFRDALADVIRADPELELVAEGASAADATRLARQHQPDVAILDVRMPGGGVPAAAEIHRTAPDVRVIMLSSFGHQELLDQMADAGALTYMRKGVSPEQIRGVVHGAVADRVATDDDRDVDELRERTILRVVEERLIDVVFQAVVDLDDGVTVGYEALARFPGSQRSPAEWFAEAERGGLRGKLEIAAAERALDAAAGLIPERFLSLNLSPDAGTMTELLGRLEGSRPGQVVIELNEQAPMEDYRGVALALGELRERGVRLALDDAGAGDASLRHVVRLAPDFIKLAGNVTRGVDGNRARRAVAAGLIGCAGELDAAIVAKGVETAAQADGLRGLGARFGQGYHFARPAAIPAGDLGAARRSATG